MARRRVVVHHQLLHPPQHLVAHRLRVVPEDRAKDLEGKNGAGVLVDWLTHAPQQPKSYLSHTFRVRCGKRSSLGTLSSHMQGT